MPNHALSRLGLQCWGQRTQPPSLCVWVRPLPPLPPLPPLMPLMPLMQAIEALLRSGGRLPLNIKVMLEGEEEVGSPHLDAFLAAHAPLLAADFVLSADGGQISETQPSLSLGLRWGGGFCWGPGLGARVACAAGLVHGLRSGRCMVQFPAWFSSGCNSAPAALLGRTLCWPNIGHTLCRPDIRQGGAGG